MGEFFFVLFVHWGLPDIGFGSAGGAGEPWAGVLLCGEHQGGIAVLGGVVAQTDVDVSGVGVFPVVGAGTPAVMAAVDDLVVDDVVHSAIADGGVQQGGDMDAVFVDVDGPHDPVRVLLPVFVVRVVFGGGQRVLVVADGAVR